MSAIKDPITKEVIATTLGAQWNDRVVQIFTTLAELKSGVYTGWSPIRGSLGYAEDVRALYEVVDFSGATPVWWPVAPRGAIVHYPASHPPSSGTVTLPGSGLVTNIVKVNGAVRYGRTYGFAYQCTIYTPSGNLGLWTGDAYIARAASPNSAIGSTIASGHVRMAGQGWAGGVFASSEISGLAVIGPVAATEPNAVFIWRGYSRAGLPDLLVVNPTLSIVELGGATS